MIEPRTLGPWLRRFLAEHIVTERNLARNTQLSYRDTFVLLIPFISARVRKPADRLAVDDLSSRRVPEFLAHLEDDRGCSVQTRNLRLSAIRAFARFVASRDPAHLEWSSSIRAITAKKAAPQPIGWLTKTEMKALIDVPDRRTPRGRVEHALLLFLFNTGARVSEATALVVRDLELGGGGDRHALVTLHGKGEYAVNGIVPESGRSGCVGQDEGVRVLPDTASRRGLVPDLKRPELDGRARIQSPRRHPDRACRKGRRHDQVALRRICSQEGVSSYVIGCSSFRSGR